MKLTPTQKRALELLAMPGAVLRTDVFCPAQIIGADVPWADRTVREPTFTVLLRHKLIERNGSPYSRDWVITDAGRRALPPED